MNFKTPMGVPATKTTSKSRAILIERSELNYREGVCISVSLKEYCTANNLTFVDYEFRGHDIYCHVEDFKPTAEEIINTHKLLKQFKGEDAWKEVTFEAFKDRECNIDGAFESFIEMMYKRLHEETKPNEQAVWFQFSGYRLEITALEYKYTDGEINYTDDYIKLDNKANEIAKSNGFDRASRISHYIKHDLQIEFIDNGEISYFQYEFLK